MDVCGEAPRRSGDSSSPEFEFWMVGNPAFPQSDLLTADELFVNGVLLPLQLLSLPHHEPEPKPEPSPKPEPEPERKAVSEPDPPPPPEPDSPSMASITSCLAPPSASKRWKEIFKVSEKKANNEKEKRKERKSSAGGSTELNININIWPFSRSRSAGNSGRPKASVAARKASSAPCSRSNSRGESSKPPAAGAPRRCAASPGRSGLSGGVHVGRTSPVWQLKRSTHGGERKEKPSISTTGGARRVSGEVRGLNLNVNSCIGYRSQVSCRAVDKDGLAGGSRSGGGDGGGNGSFFNLRTLFSKKVY